jgi:hypothetical protein
MTISAALAHVTFWSDLDEDTVEETVGALEVEDEFHKAGYV